MAGLASKENSSNRFGRGKPASRTAYAHCRTGAARFDNAVRKARSRDIDVQRSVDDGLEL
jgi:hypothetical protein